MAENSDGIGGLILLGLFGLLLTSAAKAEARERARALPAPGKTKSPPVFVPTRGKERIVETKFLLSEGERIYSAKLYEPPFVPAPWTVRAWYEPHRRAHVIDITAHPLLRAPGALAVKVFVGEHHQADREAFKRGKEPLWPDDKFENRVVHRVNDAADEVCFLIDIATREQRLDFFHEPFLIEALLLEDARPEAAKRFAVVHEIEELEKTYAYEREKLKHRTDLSPELKRQLETHLIRLFETGMQEVCGDE